MFYQFRQFWSFYRSAVTRYQLHSPLAFEVVQVLTDDDRWFYVFEDAERIRHKMLASKVEIAITDYGAGSAGRGAGQRKSTVAAIASRAGSSPAQGRKLFRLAQWVAPKTMLELGTSLGLGTLYLAAASRTAQFISLEGCPACAGVARTNLEIAGLTHAIVRAGEFGITLDKALQDLGEVDLVYLDGNHQKEPTLLYFENVYAMPMKTRFLCWMMYIGRPT